VGQFGQSVTTIDELIDYPICHDRPAALDSNLMRDAQ
jgi:hypothetical protein